MDLQNNDKNKNANGQNLQQTKVHEGHRERMRQRLANGDLDSYQTHEIVEMMLYQANKRCDTNGIAHALLKKFGSLTGIINADVSELVTVKGVGENTATIIKNYLAVFRRYKMEMLKSKKRLMTFNEVFNYANTLLEESDREELVVICLDNSYEITNVKTWQGSVNRINVLAREIVGFCYASKGVAVVLAHSHPSGLARPSADDLGFTKMLFNTLKSIDLTLLEHIIIGKDEYFSFHKQDLLLKYNQEYEKTFGSNCMGKQELVLEE
ncbi:MAG: hypothetical protein IJ301_03755 [Clostridia bacterium]|nr:hypothetical protein [Clostridia bacterium]